MAKFFTLPSFENVDAVFAVLSDVNRSAKVLAEMREMYAAINLRLGDLDTHDKVQASVSAANILLQEVQAAKQQAISAVESATEQAGKIIDEAKAEANIILDGAKEIDGKRKELLAGVEKRMKELDAREAALAVREKANNEMGDDVARRLVEIVSREKEIADRAKRIAEALG